MLLELRIVILVIIVILAVFFISMLRRRKLELKYCLVWIFGLLGMAVFCAFPMLLRALSDLLGVTTSVNTLFLVCIAFLAFICVSLTVAVSRLSDKLKKLTQNVAIKEFEEEKGKE